MFNSTAIACCDIASANERSRRGSSGGSRSPENEQEEAVGGSVSSRVESLPIKADSFSVASATIASLLLTDAEKAAVQRLMAAKQ